MSRIITIWDITIWDCLFKRKTFRNGSNLQNVSASYKLCNIKLSLSIRFPDASDKTSIGRLCRWCNKNHHKTYECTKWRAHFCLSRFSKSDDTFSRNYLAWKLHFKFRMGVAWIQLSSYTGDICVEKRSKIFEINHWSQSPEKSAILYFDVICADLGFDHIISDWSHFARFVKTLKIVIFKMDLWLLSTSYSKC